MMFLQKREINGLSACLAGWLHWNFLAPLLHGDVTATSISAAHVVWKEQWTNSSSGALCFPWTDEESDILESRECHLLIRSQQKNTHLHCFLLSTHHSLQDSVFAINNKIKRGKQAKFCEFNYSHTTVTLSFATEVIPCWQGMLRNWNNHE